MIYFKSGGSGNELRVERAGFGIHVENIAINIRNAHGVGLSVWLEPEDAGALGSTLCLEAAKIDTARQLKQQIDTARQLKQPRKRKRGNA